MTDFKSKERFTCRVDDYVKFRPSYPPALIEELKSACGAVENPVVADIGSGTGIFSTLLIQAGFTVYAVEPNSDMRQKAEESLSEFPAFHSVSADASSTTLDDSSVHAITAAQAFHWFANSNTVREFGRILKPGGAVMLAWNDRDTDSDQFHREYEELLCTYGTDYSAVNHRNITEETIRDLFRGWRCTKAQFENHQDLDFEGLKGRLESSSYCPPHSHKNYHPLMGRLQKLFDLYNSNGWIRIRYASVGYILNQLSLA